jgi:hypothetical protein
MRMIVNIEQGGVGNAYCVGFLQQSTANILDNGAEAGVGNPKSRKL